MPIEGELMEDDELDGESQEEQEPAAAVAVPVRPSVAVQESHGLTHVPYEAWCSTCVASKARNDSHCVRGSAPVNTEMLDEREVIEMDYAIMGEETIVAIYSELRHAGHATVVGHKGATA